MTQHSPPPEPGTPDASSEGPAVPEAPADVAPDASAPDAAAPDASAPGRPAAGGLTARDRAVLAMERRGWPGPGAKERAVREQLDMSPTRYYQLLNALLDDARALAHDPVTVNRLRRLRDAQRSRR